MNTFTSLLTTVLLVAVVGWTSGCRAGAAPGVVKQVVVPTATATAPPTKEPTPVKAPTSSSETPHSATQGESPIGQPTALPPIYTYEVIAEYPHDPTAFTQGLVYLDGILYEGTGLNGQSDLRKVDLETGVPFLELDLHSKYFGEGVTVLDGKIYQLTWKSQEGFLYDAVDFTPIGGFNYPSEGWGLTHDGERLIMSDGSSYLTMRDPDTFKEVDRVQVVGVKGPIQQLNELEYVDGEVFANVWQTNWIVRVDPETGEVVGYIDLTGLLNPEDVTGRVDVLNGIAYDAEHERLFVTGKLWPKLYEIELIPVQ